MYMKKHIYSKLAKIYKRKKGSKTNHRNPYLTYDKTNKHTREAGPWMPSLDNWGSRLKSFTDLPIVRSKIPIYTHLQNLLHTQSAIIMY